MPPMKNRLITLLLLAGFLLCLGISVAQPASDAVDYLNSGIKLQNNKNYTGAIQKYTLALKVMGPNHPYKGVAYMYLGQSYLRLKKGNLAQQQFNLALPLVRKHQGANSKYEARIYMSLGNFHTKKEQYGEAETAYKKSLALFETRLKKDPEDKQAREQLVNLHYNLGNAYGKQENYTQAIQAFNAGIALQKSVGETNTHLMGEFLNGLGITHLKNNENERGLSYLKQAMAIYLTTVGPEDSQTRTLKNLIALIETQNQQTTPVTTSGSSQQGANEPTGLTNSASTVDPNSFAGLYQAARKAWDEDRWEESEALFKRALEKSKGLNLSDSFLASVKNALGYTLYFQKKHTEAEPYLRDSFAVYEKEYPPGDKNLGYARLILGQNYFEQKKYVEAEALLRQNIDKIGIQDENALSLYKTLAFSLYYQGKFDEALPYFHQVKSLLVEKQGEDSLSARSIQLTLDELEKVRRSTVPGQDNYLFNFIGELSRWRNHQKEVVVYLPSGTGLLGWSDEYIPLTKAAFFEWEKALNHRFKFVYTQNPVDYDIQFVWSPNVIDSDEVSHRLGLSTTKTVNYFFTEKVIKIALADQSGVRSAQDVYAVLLHEIGHSLGVGHSNNPADVMSEYANYKSGTGEEVHLTPRDIRTVQVLYQLEPKNTSPRNVTLSQYSHFLEKLEAPRKAFNKGKYKKAYKLLAEVRGIYADDPYTNYLYALTAMERKKNVEAIQVLQQTKFPSNDHRYSLNKTMGYAYVELGHQFRKKKKRAIQFEGGMGSMDYYAVGVNYLSKALNDPYLASNQREAIERKLKEGIQRRRSSANQYYHYPVYVRMR